jgi:hypothetical protein
MDLYSAILKAVLSLPVWGGDIGKEIEAERTARMETIAHAIVAASGEATCEESEVPAYCEKTWSGSRTTLAFLLVEQAYVESSFARHIHAGQ